ncbi:MAG: amino acid adenylation domain-containing protein [Candidatus Cloacimonetes bacterium]|nr:amino acid adenylation domain-containing protein [Candidatus Cloacimonadota bacterium]
MNTLEFLSYIRSLDIKLFVKGEQLHCNAPKGILTPALQSELSEHKAEILTLLRKVDLAAHSKIPPILPVSRAIDLPLSFSQQRLWFLAQLEPYSAVNNMFYAFRLNGLLNVSVLERSLKEIVRRHEILRTTFQDVDGQPFQVISPDVELKLKSVNLRELTEIEQKAETQRLMNDERSQPFDLVNGPLFRIKLLHLAEDSYILLLTIHHIVFDGWSLSLFLHEFAALYKAFLKGKPSPLSELPIQYADFTIWQREWLQHEVIESQLSYWKQQLSADLPVLQLPTDHPRPVIQSHCGEHQTLVFPQNLTEKLNTLSHEEGATLFMTLLSAFKTLLYHYTDQEDIIVGTPIAGRNCIETEELIGFFINTLVFRTDLSGNPSFRELLSRIREVALGAYAHQDLPFEKLLEELQPERDLSRTPLFQVFFNMLNFPEIHIKLPGLTIEELALPEIFSKFDLTLYVNEKNHRIHLDLVYNTELFRKDRMIEMLEQYRYLLSQIVEKPDKRISHFSLVTPTAQAILPDPSEELDSTWEGAIHTLFSQQAKCMPDSTAIEYSNKTWSYKELDALTNQLANYLISIGIKRQDIIAIYGHRSASLIWAILGVLKAGASFFILDSSYPCLRLIDYLKIAKPKAWIQIEEAGALPGILEKFVSNLSCYCRLKLPEWSSPTTNSLLLNYSTEDPEITVSPDDIAYIGFTSGSTGKPKGIMGRHGSISHFLPWLRQTFNLNESDKFSIISGISYDPLQREIFTPLQIGATICVPDSEDIEPGRLGKWMRKKKISIVHLTPAMGEILTETTPKATLISLRYAFFLGDMLTKRDVSRIQKFAPYTTVVNLYGTTETQRAVGYFVVSNKLDISHDESRVNESINDIIPLGKGMKDVQLLILNNSKQLSGIGEKGEIYLRSPHLAKGYINNNELTHERFIINPFTKISRDKLYKTGDLGRYMPDGNIEFLGRIDYQVKIRGFRVELEEIEAMLKQHPDVRQTVVVTRNEQPENKYLVAYVVSKKKQVSISSELRCFLKQRLPDYMVPSNFVIIDSLPITPNGKVDRHALPEPDKVRHELEKTFVAPRNELELRLTKIWEKVLCIKNIGVRDNFFDMGGHSLLAVRLFSQIEKTTGRNLPLITLFQAPTVELLSKVLREEGWSPSWSSLVPIQTEGSKQPFFCVPGPAGYVLCFADFAHYLGSEQPFYGLRPKGLDGEEVPYTCIEKMAEHYINEIRTIQSEGPYFLGGNCFGGIVAFEMAQQLQAQGQKVDLLALFEAYVPGTVYPLSGIKPFFIRLIQRIRRHLNNLSRLSPKEKFLYFMEESRNAMKSKIWKIAYKFYLDIGRPLPHAFRSVREANFQALRDYVPKVYSGKLYLYQSDKRFAGFYYEPQMGWEKLATGGIEIYKVPGNHESIWNEPNLKVLAKKLSVCLDKAQRAEPSKAGANSG